MLQLFQAIPFAFAAIFPVLNPLGSAVIFLTLAPDLTEPEYRQLALRITINTIILLVAVLIAGSWVLRFFGISLPVVQIGGGLVVAYIGWNLLNKPLLTMGETATVQDQSHLGLRHILGQGCRTDGLQHRALAAGYVEQD